jgi:glutamate dehydrogenase (NAD(P)+)
MKKLGLSVGLEGKRVVVQGLGNVGAASARFLQEDGCLLVGLAEYEGAIYDPKGLDVDAVIEHRKATGSILGYPGASDITPTALALELECDILVPAALENQITAENAPRIQARIVGEAANGPTTARASRMLAERGVMVVPDAFLNSGGVTVSYFEWLKNLQHVRFGRLQKRSETAAYGRLLKAITDSTGKTFSVDEQRTMTHGASEIDLVRSGLEETMIDAFHQIREKRLSINEDIDLRTATLVVAINKVARTYEAMGIFP